MKKRIIALLTAVMLTALLLAGCSVTADKPAEDSEFEVGEAANAAQAYDTIEYFSCVG